MYEFREDPMTQTFTAKYSNDQVSTGYQFAHRLARDGWNVEIDSTTEKADKYDKMYQVIIVKATLGPGSVGGSGGADPIAGGSRDFIGGGCSASLQD